MEQIERVMNKLYEDNALGNIEANRYELLSRKYAEEYYSLKTEQEKIEERLSEFENANQRAKNFIRLAESYSDFEELTTTAIEGRNRRSQERKITSLPYQDRKSVV